MPLRTEEAREHLIAQLANIPASVGRNVLVSTRYAHLYLPDFMTGFWRVGGVTYLTDEQCRPFYDAAWELIVPAVLCPPNPI
jgi:hypothetical protein